MRYFSVPASLFRCEALHKAASRRLSRWVSVELLSPVRRRWNQINHSCIRTCKLQSDAVVRFRLDDLIVGKGKGTRQGFELG